MKIFIDSADTAEIEKYMGQGLCDGVTTNPTICLKCGVRAVEIKEHSVKIAKVIAPRPLSVEVTSDRPEEILVQAREYSCWADNIAVKVTITDREGNSLLPVIYQLVSENIQVNVTAMMTFKQMILAAKCIESARQPDGPVSFISLFAGRVADEQDIEQAVRVIKETRQWLDFYGYSSEIIVGSIRQPENVDAYAKSGAHVLTIPPSVLDKCLLAARTKETVVQFLEDAQKALG